MSTCKECEAEIRWIEMESGKVMPCEEQQSELVIVAPDGKGHLHFGYKPHWAQCPASNFFKQKRREGR
jgi:hypothetical protein